MKKITYIYTLTDPTTGLVRYVGKTVNPKRRLHEHMSHAKNTTSSNYNLHSANWIRLLIKENKRPILNIIDIAGKNCWECKEQYWIKWYRDKNHDLTNIEDGGSSNKKGALKARKLIKEVYSKEVEMFSMGNEFLRSFKSASEAAKFLDKKSKAPIQYCASGRTRSVYGYKWKYKNETWVYKKKLTGSKKRIVLKIDSDGNILERFLSFKDIIEKYPEYNKNYIISCCNKYQNTYLGYKWVYENKEVLAKRSGYKYKEVLMFDMNSNLLRTFPSVISIEKELGFNHSAIANCCSNRQKSSYGYFWKYK
jgi:hypothetical protein